MNRLLAALLALNAGVPPSQDKPAFPGVDASTILTLDILQKVFPGRKIAHKSTLAPTPQGPRSWTSVVKFTDGEYGLSFSADLGLRTYGTPQEALDAVEASRKGHQANTLYKPGDIVDSPRGPKAFTATMTKFGVTSVILEYAGGTNAVTLTLMSEEAAVPGKILDLSKAFQVK